MIGTHIRAQSDMTKTVMRRPNFDEMVLPMMTPEVSGWLEVRSRDVPQMSSRNGNAFEYDRNDDGKAYFLVCGLYSPNLR